MQCWYKYYQTRHIVHLLLTLERVGAHIPPCKRGEVFQLPFGPYHINDDGRHPNAPRELGLLALVVGRRPHCQDLLLLRLGHHHGLGPLLQG